MPSYWSGPCARGHRRITPNDIFSCCVPCLFPRTIRRRTSSDNSDKGASSICINRSRIPRALSSRISLHMSWCLSPALSRGRDADFPPLHSPLKPLCAAPSSRLLMSSSPSKWQVGARMHGHLSCWPCLPPPRPHATSMRRKKLESLFHEMFSSTSAPQNLNHRPLEILIVLAI
ncbi:hypothetical protein BC834DRAFT_574950 [Gloeopeniophorella convolvens]|nr:hypothetical protein BC834DRAFT_574950 [Gloeopeniophorella convolvens]